MRYLIKCSYLGTNYYGWAKQVGQISVQEVIESNLSRYFNSEISIFASGRTDAGVHALGQTFHFDVDKEIKDTKKFLYSLNMMLGDDIHFLSVKRVKEDFHARFSAKGKTYIYKFYIGENNPFENQTRYHCPRHFNYQSFRRAMSLFLGKHNFKNFTSKETDEKDFVRTVTSIGFAKGLHNINVYISGNGFMRYQIRYMVGTAFAVAEGKLTIKELKKILNDDTRRIVSYKADGCGLYLKSVKY